MIHCFPIFCPFDDVYPGYSTPLRGGALGAFHPIPLSAPGGDPHAESTLGGI